MKLLIVSQSESFISETALKLIPSGIEVNKAKTTDEIKNWLKNPSHNLILFQIDDCNNCFVDYIVMLKENSSFQNLKIAVCLPRTSHQCLKKLLGAGISAFIYNTDIKEYFETQLASLINYFESDGERRAHVRIELLKSENAKVSFNHKNTQIDAPVIKISTVALSIEASDNMAFEISEKKEMIENITINLDGESSFFNAIPIRSDNKIVLMYANVKDDFLRVVCGYIYKKLNSKN
jgi:ribosome-associated translation inhibitor RaiA